MYHNYTPHWTLSKYGSVAYKSSKSLNVFSDSAAQVKRGINKNFNIKIELFPFEINTCLPQSHQFFWAQDTKEIFFGLICSFFKRQIIYSISVTNKSLRFTGKSDYKTKASIGQTSGQYSHLLTFFILFSFSGLSCCIYTTKYKSKEI